MPGHPLVSAPMRIFASAMLVCWAMPALGGSNPGHLNCSKAGVSVSGTVPADSVDTNLELKKGSKNVFLVDELTAGQLSAEEKQRMGDAPKVLVDVSDDSSDNPGQGRYLLRVTGTADATD